MCAFLTGQWVYPDALVDWQGRLPFHGWEGRLRLHTEESQAGASDRYEDFTYSWRSVRYDCCCCCYCSSTDQHSRLTLTYPKRCNWTEMIRFSSDELTNGQTGRRWLLIIGWRVGLRRFGSGLGKWRPYRPYTSKTANEIRHMWLFS